MVKINSSTPGLAAPTVDDTRAARETTALGRTSDVRPTIGVQPGDGIDAGAASRPSATGAVGTRPESEASGGGLQDIAALVNHPQFGSPDVAPALGPDMEQIPPDPTALAVDVPALLRDAQAHLDPSSPHAQAIGDLSVAFGGLEHLAPENYVKGSA